MKNKNLGDQELMIYNYIHSKNPISVRDVAEHFDKEKKLARTTILTVMERLRKKGFLSRTKTNGLFMYTIKFEQEKIIKQKVSDFIQKTLGGSMNPLLSYFIDSDQLSKDEIQQLKSIAEKMNSKEVKS